MGVVDSRELPWNEPPGHFGGFSKFLVNDFISGTAVATYGEERFVVTKGFTMFVPPGVKHSVENTGDEDLVFIVTTSPPNDIARN